MRSSAAGDEHEREKESHMSVRYDPAAEIIGWIWKIGVNDGG